MFRPHWSIIREKATCTVTGAACSVGCVCVCVCVCTVNTPKATGCSNYCAHFRLYKSYTDELTAVLPHKIDDKKFKPLSYATMLSLMMD